MGERPATAGSGASEPSAAPSRRSWWSRVAIACVGALLGLVLAELGLRAVGFEYRLAPEAIEFGAPSREQIKTHFAQDADLIWVPKDYQGVLATCRLAKPPLVFMGDSCTHLGLYPSRFVELLQETAGGEPLTIGNLGVVGWSTYQGRRQLERDVVPIGPRVVTLFYGWNDHWVGFGVEDEQVGRIASFARFGLSETRLAQLAAQVLIAADPQSGTRPNRVSLADFRENLTYMVRTAREHGIEPVLITAPSHHTPGQASEQLLERFLRSADELVPLHASYVEAVREVAAAEHAPLCDLAEHFAQRSDRAEFFHDDGIHLTDEGDDVIAEQLVETFREHGLIERLFESHE